MRRTRCSQGGMGAGRNGEPLDESGRREERVCFVGVLQSSLREAGDNTAGGEHYKEQNED